jgi:peptidoglycan/LPS O-acetylase OafA/YrhL
VTTAATAPAALRAARRKQERGFLPEVQVLRAVAVAAVVLYHLWPNRLPGGFVGVDVFFAVSGFLITSHLIRPMIAGRRVDVLRFWSNRIWRLLPASLLVLAACWLFTLWLTPPPAAGDAFRQIGAAGAYVVNWLLAVDAVDYLARDNAPTIVQHYWTLSVEEQFYFVWPLLLVAAVILAAKRAQHSRRSPRPSLALGVVIGLVVLCSFAYSIVVTEYAPARAYFDTAARVWEFGLGALLALLLERFPVAVARFREHGLVARAAAPLWIGVAMIALSALGMSDRTPFPSGWAALPVVGALVVIAGGTPRGPWLKHAVRWRPVQYLGDISYSLYLWHWPLIVGFGLVAARPHGLIEGLCLLGLAIALAAVTKVAVEDPFRRFGRAQKRVSPAFALAAVGAALLLVGGVTVNSLREAESAQAAAAREARITDAGDCFGAHATLGTGSCDDPFELSAGSDPVLPSVDLDPDWCLTWFDQDWLSCEFGAADAASGTVAIVGDSHAAALTNPLGEYLSAEGYRLVTFTRFGCPALAESRIALRAQTPLTQEACAEWTSRVTDELVARDDINTVIYTSFESAYARYEEAGVPKLTSDDIVSTLARVADSGKEVVLLRDLPATAGADVPTCVAGARQDVADKCSVPLAEAFPEGPFESAAMSLGDRVRTLDLRDAVCDDRRCYGVVGDVIVYADDNHVSKTFARTLMPYFFDRLRSAKTP